MRKRRKIRTMTMELMMITTKNYRGGGGGLYGRGGVG